MEVVASPLQWTNEDASTWSKFLDTPTGKRIIPRLLEAAPTLLATGDVNAILIRSGELRGFQSSATELLGMAHEQQGAPKVIENYPELTNDAAWDDGKKLNDPAPPEFRVLQTDVPHLL
jgi:hypothetical protein